MDRTTSHIDERHFGYTLLELLIVMALMSLLMVGVWSLLSNWGGLYERGERRARKAQLVRSLSDQFTDDLHDVTYRAPARATRRRSSAPAPSGIGLVGDKDWLVLDVLQPVNPYHHSQAEVEEATLVDESQSAAWVPEVQRIMYRFYPRTETADQPVLEDQAMSFYGLVRIGIAREFYSELTAQDGSAGQMGAGATTLMAEIDQICSAAISPTETDASMLEASANMADETDVATMGRPQWLPGVIQQDEVPEVGWLEFRYFNGSGWQDQWDSRTQKRLPVAVEVRFELIEPPTEEELVMNEEEAAEAKFSDTGMAEPPDDSALLEGEQPEWAEQGDMFGTTETVFDEPPPYYRCVVYLEPPKQWPAPVEDETLAEDQESAGQDLSEQNEPTN